MSYAITDLLHKNMLNPIQACKSVTEPERMCLFWGAPLAKDLIHAIDQGYSILVEGRSVRELMKQGDCHADLVISLTNQTAYDIDFTKILEHYFFERTNISISKFEKIITATYEAYSNALIWDNLEMSNLSKERKSLEFFQQVENRLIEKNIKNCSIQLTCCVFQKYVEISVTSTGKGFDLESCLKTANLDYQGLSIMKTFSDKLWTENKGKTIKMKFKI